MEHCHVAIIGGGGAGLAAAVASSEAGASTVILEKNGRVGKKLLTTGNGRCNMTNLAVSPNGYSQPGFVAGILSRFGCGELRGHFEKLGLWSRADAEGRVYPISDSSASVLDVLRRACAERGATERCGFEAVSVSASDGGFVVASRSGDAIGADAVIVATGGGATLLSQAGHPIVPFSPVLCPLATDIATIRGLSGLRRRCRATLTRGGTVLAEETGEVLFRDYGVSGITVFDLSRFASSGDELYLDLMPDMDEALLSLRLAERASNHPDWAGAEFLTGIFHKRVAQAILKAAGAADPDSLCRAIKHFRLQVTGTGDEKQAQVTRGGADISGFSPLTLESMLSAGLYAAGETLDIDGRCGGYNLHWAFASGFTAGEHAAGRSVL